MVALRRRLAAFLALAMTAGSLPFIDVPVYAEDRIPVEECLEDEALAGESLLFEETGGELTDTDNLGSNYLSEETALTEDISSAEEIILEGEDLLAEDRPKEEAEGNEEGSDTPYVDVRFIEQDVKFIPVSGFTEIPEHRSMYKVSENKVIEFAVEVKGDQDGYTPFATLAPFVLKPSKEINSKRYEFKVTADEFKKAMVYGNFEVGDNDPFKVLFIGASDKKITLDSSSSLKSAVFRAYSDRVPVSVDGFHAYNGPADVYKEVTDFYFRSGTRVAITGLGKAENGVSNPKDFIKVTAGDKTYYGNRRVDANYELFNLGTLNDDTSVKIEARSLPAEAITAKGATVGDYEVICTVEDSDDGYVPASSNGVRVDFLVHSTKDTAYRIVADNAGMKVGGGETENVSLTYDPYSDKYSYTIPFDKLAKAAYSNNPSIEFTLDVKVAYYIDVRGKRETFKPISGLKKVQGLDDFYLVTGDNGFEFSVSNNEPSYTPFAALVPTVIDASATGAEYTYTVSGADLEKASHYGTTEEEHRYPFKMLFVNAVDGKIILNGSSDVNSAVVYAYDETGYRPDYPYADVYKGKTEYGFRKGYHAEIRGLGSGSNQYGVNYDFIRVQAEGPTGSRIYYGDRRYNNKGILFDLGTLSEDTVLTINSRQLATDAITADGKAGGDYKVKCMITGSKKGYVTLGGGNNSVRVKFAVTGTGTNAYRIASEKAQIQLGNKAAESINLSRDGSDGLYYYDIPFEILAEAAYLDDPSIKFTADIELDPAYVQYSISVQDGATAKIGDKAVFSAKEGEEVSLAYTGEAKEIQFDKWDVTGAVVNNASARNTTFIMGRKPVQVRYSVKVNEDSKKEELPKDADTSTKVNKLNFESKVLKLKTGEVKKNAATPVMGGGNAPTVQYITDNADIVAVSPEGNFIAIGPGKTKVTAYCGTKSAVCNVTVGSYTTDIAILNIDGSDVTDKTLNMKAGEQTSLEVSFLPADTSDSRAVKWKSSNREVTVKNGMVTVKELKKAVEAKITAKVMCTDPSTGKSKPLTKTVTIKAEPIKVITKNDASSHHKLAINRKSVKLNTKDGKNKSEINITLTPKNNAAVDKCDLKVETSNAAIVSVDKIGALTVNPGGKGTASVSIEAKKPGTAYIIVESTDPADKSKVNRQRCKVTVTCPAESVKITGDSRGLLKTEGSTKSITIREGQYDDLTAVIEPEFSTDAAKGLKWSASGGVTVKNGLLYAKKATTSGKVTVKCGKLKETIKVTVTGK